MVWSPRENDDFFGEPQEEDKDPPSKELGPNAPKLTSEQVCNIGFAVLRAHNDDRLWRALTYDSGPYDLTTPNLALQELGAAFYAAGHADAPKTTMKVESMNMAKIEARAAELHDGCQMPMEQARELAASEASPDWYARGQDWGLADALTNGQSGDWVLDDIARAFAAGAQAGAAVDQHTIKRMQAALAENASHSADYLRKAIKWEARAAELATDAQRYRIMRNCNMDVRNRLEHYGGDALDERLDALNSLALGPNVRANLPP